MKGPLVSDPLFILAYSLFRDIVMKTYLRKFKFVMQNAFLFKRHANISRDIHQE